MVVYFYYPVAKTLTGQEMASRLILNTLSGQCAFKVRKIPAFDRTSSGPLYALRYMLLMMRHWFSIAKLVFVAKPKIYLNMGQSLASMFRDGIPLAVLRRLKPSSRFVVSLHGHVFTTWTTRSFKAKLFRFVLREAECITVLGEVQKEKLIALGIESANVEIVNNTCEFSASDAAAMGRKEEEPVNILYLSNLIESKGYREFLKAIECLACKSEVKVNAVLCGKLDISTDVGDAASVGEAEAWINNRILGINSAKNATITWLKGAYGDDKRALFDTADIFVFPSQYRVEAQPIVLIEAMASGCAVITSAVGEIPSTVGQQCALVLKDCSAQNIARAIESTSPEALAKMKAASAERFTKLFSNESYARRWFEVFSVLENGR